MTTRPSKPRTMHLLRVTEVFDGKDYPVRMHSTDLGIFSSLARARAFLAEQVVTAAREPFADEYPVLHYELVEVALDRRYTTVRYRTFAADGTQRGSAPYFTSGPRGSRPRSPFRFQVGDLVELMQCDHLRLGIVVAHPLTPEQTRAFWEPAAGGTPEELEDYALGEPYQVFFEEDGDHEHPEECDLSPPRFAVPEALVALLRERMMRTGVCPPAPGRITGGGTPSPGP
jgi:hypothetical protein